MDGSGGIYRRLPLPPPRMSWLDVVASMPRGEAEALAEMFAQEAADGYDPRHDWAFLARREQLPPDGSWLNWMILAGRGWGKTRTGAEWIKDQHAVHGKRVTGIIASTSEDLRRYCIRGPSGVLSIAGKDFFPEYQPSNTRLLWPDGSETLFFTAEEPNRLRGPNLQAAWCDEFAAWKYLEDTWDNLMFALRESELPQTVITTTPKPRKLLREVMADPDTIVTRGSTLDNRRNLSTKAVDRMIRRYEGTRIGRQEIDAEILDEADGALFKREWIDNARRRVGDVPALVRSCVAIDPAASDTEESAETGIIHAGVGEDRRGYVDGDYSGRYSPSGWAEVAIRVYFERRANYIVAEKNNGGDMVLTTVRATAREMRRAGQIPTDDVPTYLVWASKGKAARAEPVSLLYERGLVSHVGVMSALEDQMCTWEPASGERSPDRLDAVVWALTRLMVDEKDIPLISPTGLPNPRSWRI